MEQFVADLSKRLKEYIDQRHGRNIRQGARYLHEDYDLIYRLYNERQKSISFVAACNILSQIAGDESLAILGEYFPYDMQMIQKLAKGQKEPNLIAAANRRFQPFLQNETSFKIFLMVSSGSQWFVPDIKKELGPQGVAGLEHLVKEGVLWITDNQEIKTDIDGHFKVSQEIIKKILHMQIENIDFNIPATLIDNIVGAVSKEGLAKIYAALADSIARIKKIIEEDKGDTIVLASLFMGPLLMSAQRGNQGVNQDFEARVNTFRKAYELDEATARKVAMVAHDMRGPLGYIQNYMEKLDARNQGDEDFHLARSAMNRINTMVHSFKDLNSSAIIVRKNEMIYLDECRDIAESYAHQYGKTFEYLGSLEFQGDLDAEKIDRALQNLITNAFEAAESQVRVEVVRRDSDFVLEVRDNGPGVSEPNIPKLFQQGFTEGKVNGTGLGLAFVKHVTEGHGGTIGYQRIEAWSVFTMTIPHVFFDDLLESDWADVRSEPLLLEDDLDEAKALLQRPVGKKQWEKQDRMKEVLAKKPVLLVLLDFPHWTQEKLEELRQLLPTYEVSGSYEDVERSWLICLGSDDPYYDYIMVQRLNSVWMPSDSSLASPSLVETIGGIARHELIKFVREKDKALVGQET